VTVKASTANDTATLADLDYQQQNNITVSFGAGVTTQSFDVLVNGDTQFEPDETFKVNLTNPNANVDFTTGVHTGIGTITNDDSPAIVVNSPSIQEGNAGTTNLVFTVSIGTAVGTNVTFDYETFDGT